MEDNIHPSDLWSGALIAIGLVILQGFFPSSTLDPAASVSVVAFAIAIPILSCNVLTNFLRRRHGGKKGSYPVWEILFYSIGILAAFIGITAAFWYTYLISALVFLFISLISSIIFSIVRRSIS